MGVNMGGDMGVNMGVNMGENMGVIVVVYCKRGSTQRFKL